MFMKTRADYDNLIGALIQLNATYDLEPSINSGIEPPDYSEVSQMLGRRVDKNNKVTNVFVSFDIAEPETPTPWQKLVLDSYKNTMYVFIHEESIATRNRKKR